MLGNLSPCVVDTTSKEAEALVCSGPYTTVSAEAMFKLLVLPDKSTSLFKTVLPTVDAPILMPYLTWFEPPPCLQVLLVMFVYEVLLVMMLLNVSSVAVPFVVIKLLSTRTLVT
jgi:hypothetical protein